ncbi:uncharacterized protein LOC128551245 [Mercenaria mercenaria]|uniref:uncharacterized protein LOC128551245 n=1 Tax=Mercenaria mercenaria TaxID=6596 RepID=UPI00234E6523|nr:uncharacterized protein LOC128551245 [Mercenaria mercenaria]
MADTKKYDYVFKVLIIGEVASGKTALLDRYAENSFTDAYIPTIGVDFVVKKKKYNGKIIKAQVWDTAGQERSRALTASFYRGCHGVIIVFDVTNRSTFERVENRITEFEVVEKSTFTLLNCYYNNGQAHPSIWTVPFIICSSVN